MSRLDRSPRSGRPVSGRPQVGTPRNLRYPLPAQSVRAWGAYQEKRPQNPGLIFDRYAPDWRSQPTLKADGLKEICRAATRVDQELLRAWILRWDQTARAAGAVPFSLATDWRFITGLGAHGPLEVGFRFHRYGFPFLPGSGVKGLARTAGLVAIAEALEASSLSDLDAVLSLEDDGRFQEILAQKYAPVERAVELAQRFRAIFGTTGAAGGAVFFDALPAQVPKLELDIMNPHYPAYYQRQEAPTAWQSPVPVPFLTVAPRTEFRFAVGWRGEQDAAAGELREQAEAWLRTGLMELGAGAKTGAGYGYFVPPAPVPEAETPSRARGAPDAGGAPVAPVPQAPAPPPAEPVVTRRGRIVEMQPARRQGRVRDSETEREYRFTMSELAGGQTPARREEVEFDLQGDRVVQVRRLR